jgi:hypothetical protein
MRKFLFPALIFVNLNCSTHSTNNNSKLATKPVEDYPIRPLIIYNGVEDGWGADIRLSIKDIVENDSVTIYTVLSSWHDKNLGLSLAIPKKVGEKGFGNGIELTSLGKESDYLLTTLAKLYKQKLDSAAQFKTRIVVSYINLDDFGKSLGAKSQENDTSGAKYKIFFEGHQQDDNAELYLNVNSSAKWVEIREKDDSYREPIIKFLKK